MGNDSPVSVETAAQQGQPGTVKLYGADRGYRQNIYEQSDPHEINQVIRQRRGGMSLKTEPDPEIPQETGGEGIPH